jgi:hypothetical protein
MNRLSISGLDRSGRACCGSSDSACESVSTFAYNLGHQCLNEVMKAILIGRDIPSHMTDNRTDHIDRHEKARTTGDIEALFVAWT